MAKQRKTTSEKPVPEKLKNEKLKAIVYTSSLEQRDSLPLLWSDPNMKTLVACVDNLFYEIRLSSPNDGCFPADVDARGRVRLRIDPTAGMQDFRVKHEVEHHSGEIGIDLAADVGLSRSPNYKDREEFKFLKESGSVFLEYEGADNFSRRRVVLSRDRFAKMKDELFRQLKS